MRKLPKFTDAPNSFIYHITVKSKMYKGQTSRKSPTAYKRIIEHLNAAYYKEIDSSWYITDSEQELHEDMAKYTLSDLKIDIYPAPDFGISNFQALCNEFKQDWRGYPNEPTLLDLAEIFHIQWAITKGISLYNTQMGGQNQGFYPINLGKSDFEEYLKNYNEKTGNPTKDIKVLLRTDSPQVARSKMTKEGAKMQGINLVMKKFYDTLFGEEWKNTAQKILDKFISTARKEKMNMSLVKMTWKEFVTGSSGSVSLKDFIAEELLPSELTKILKDKNIKASIYRKTSQEWKQKMQNFIYKNFLKPKELLLKILFKSYGRQFDKNFDLNLKLKNEINKMDFSHLTNYIAQSIFMFTGKGKYNININKVADFTAVNMTAAYEISHSYVKPNGRGGWITRIDITPDHPIPLEWLKQRSLLMFEHFWQKYKKENPFNNFISNFKESENWSAATSTASDGKPILRMNWVKEQNLTDWLSHSLMHIYERYAPGYIKRWWDFYRPMVEWWKQNSVYNEISTFQSANGTEYNGWYYKKQRIYIGYQSYNVLPQKREITVY